MNNFHKIGQSFTEQSVKDCFKFQHAASAATSAEREPASNKPGIRERDGGREEI